MSRARCTSAPNVVIYLLSEAAGKWIDAGGKLMERPGRGPAAAAGLLIRKEEKMGIGDDGLVWNGNAIGLPM